MSEPQLISIGGWIIAGLFTLLTALLGWLGNKVVKGVERIDTKLSESLDVIHGRITDVDRRVTRVEAHVAHVNTFAQSGRQWPPVLGK